MLARNTLALLAATSLLGACATAAPPITNTLATVSLRTADGSPAGTATIVATDGRASLQVNAQGLTPGAHGVHLHTTGLCEAPAFASAGGHLNPHAKQHGVDNPQGSHLGDLPNLTAEADGTGSLTVKLTTPQGELESLLFDSDGTALVIHAAADDYKTDPSGNSGGRIACGVLTRR